MFCRFCGNQVNDNDKFCPNCGHEINPVETKIVVKERGPWKGFAIAGFVLGIVSISTFFAIEYSIYLSILGIVFSALGKKSISKNAKAKTGLKLSITACALNVATFVFCYLFMLFIYFCFLCIIYLYNLGVLEILQSYL